MKRKKIEKNTFRSFARQHVKKNCRCVWRNKGREKKWEKYSMARSPIRCIVSAFTDSDTTITRQACCIKKRKNHFIKTSIWKVTYYRHPTAIFYVDWYIHVPYVLYVVRQPLVKYVFFSFWGFITLFSIYRTKFWCNDMFIMQRYLCLTVFIFEYSYMNIMKRKLYALLFSIASYKV